MNVAIRRGFVSVLLVSVSMLVSYCNPFSESCGECYDRCTAGIDCDAICAVDGSASPD